MFNKFRSFSCVVFAGALLLSAPVMSAPIDDASKYVESLGNNAVETLSSKTLSKAKKTAKIEELFRENVDIAWVGKFVMGRFWRQATDGQKARYLKAYEKFIISHYATRFTEYSSGSFKITDARDDGDDEFTISMKIHSGEPSAEPVAIDYRVRKASKNPYIVFDIIVEGVSMITTQRSEFSSVISNKGIDYLITQLTNDKLVNDKIGAESAK